jgi:retron-type reverse transcriptase
MEGRGCQNTELREGKMEETSGSPTVLTKQLRIAKLAVEAPTMAFTTLAHHIDIDWMREAFRRTRKDGAAGVDGQTAQDYAANLEENLRSLLERAKSGSYRAPPVRRVHIPKGDGSQTRPIGIPAFEDKVLQRAVVMVLEPIYEQDFLNCSYGFRPGRSAHQALEEFRRQTMDMQGGWVLEIDIKKFFDTLDHGHLREIVQKRVRDGTLLRLIGKWLNAGVLESGSVTYPDAGSPRASDPLRGRCGDGLQRGKRRAKGDERVTQTVWEIRPHPASREDPADPVSAASKAREIGSKCRSWNVRPAGLHALLGIKPERQLGR